MELELFSFFKRGEDAQMPLPPLGLDTLMSSVRFEELLFFFFFSICLIT